MLRGERSTRILFNLLKELLAYRFSDYTESITGPLLEIPVFVNPSRGVFLLRRHGELMFPPTPMTMSIRRTLKKKTHVEFIPRRISPHDYELMDDLVRHS